MFKFSYWHVDLRYMRLELHHIWITHENLESLISRRVQTPGWNIFKFDKLHLFLYSNIFRVDPNWHGQFFKMTANSSENYRQFLRNHGRLLEGPNDPSGARFLQRCDWFGPKMHNIDRRSWASLEPGTSRISKTRTTMHDKIFTPQIHENSRLKFERRRDPNGRYDTTRRATLREERPYR